MAAGSTSSACAFISAMNSGRISGGGIEMPWCFPVASVNRSFRSVTPRYQMKYTPPGTRIESSISPGGKQNTMRPLTAFRVSGGTCFSSMMPRQAT